MPRLMKKQCFTAPTSAVHNRKTSLYTLPGGVMLQLQSPDPSMYFSKEFQETRVGSPDCSSGYHITNCPGIQRGGGAQWSKVKGGNGWREEEMLNYKVMVRKPIWQGIWKSKAYSIRYHPAMRSPQPALFPVEGLAGQGEGRALPSTEETTSKLSPSPEFLSSSYSSAWDRIWNGVWVKVYVGLTRNMLVMNAQWWLSGVYINSTFLLPQLFLNQSRTILITHTME